MQAWLFSISFALAAGGSLVLQQAVNANLRMALQSAAWAGFFSYLVGLICMTVAVVAMREAVPDWSAIRSVHWSNWLGGALGSIYIAAAILLLPVLGSTMFVALLITGQLITALAFDHFGLFGLAQQPIDLTRLIGVGMLIGGVTLIHR